MTETPGVYLFVGARDDSLTAYYGHHHPQFTIDEEALPLAAALLASTVGAYVLGP